MIALWMLHISVRKKEEKRKENYLIVFTLVKLCCRSLNLIRKDEWRWKFLRIRKHFCRADVAMVVKSKIFVQNTRRFRWLVELCWVFYQVASTFLYQWQYPVESAYRSRNQPNTPQAFVKVAKSFFHFFRKRFIASSFGMKMSGF